MMNYFKMLVSEIAVFKNFEIPCYTLNLSYFTLSTHPIAPVSQGDFLHWSCSLYSWLNGCRNRTPAVISFNQSTVDFISGRKDPLYLSIGDNCCPSSQHSTIEVAVRQCMATTLLYIKRKNLVCKWNVFCQDYACIMRPDARGWSKQGSQQHYAL